MEIGNILHIVHFVCDVVIMACFYFSLYEWRKCQKEKEEIVDRFSAEIDALRGEKDEA